MSCAACAARVERAVSGVKGVTACSVNLLTNSMGVEGTAAMISSASAVPSTPMELVRRLTEQEVTPFTPDTAFSTRAAQAAQLIPVTVYCSIIELKRLLLLHQFLQGSHQFVDDFILAFPDIPGNTAPDMARQQLLIKGIDRSVHSGRLD